MQLSYAQNNVAAVAGMRSECFGSEYIQSFIAASTIEPGTVVEQLANGKVQKCQSTGATVTIAGVALFGVTTEQSLQAIAADGQRSAPGVYVAGDHVPVMRQGRVWCPFDGTTQANLKAANVIHSSQSTGASAAHNGWLTDAATSSTAGIEVGSTNLLFIGVTGIHASVTGLALVEVHTP